MKVLAVSVCSIAHEKPKHVSHSILSGFLQNRPDVSLAFLSGSKVRPGPLAERIAVSGAPKCALAPAGHVAGPVRDDSRGRRSGGRADPDWNLGRVAPGN